MKLQTRLVLLFFAATVIPLTITAWLTTTLLDRSLSFSSVQELDEVSRTLESTGKDLYRQVRSSLQAQAKRTDAPVQRFPVAHRAQWPQELISFWDGGRPDQISLSGPHGELMTYYVRDSQGIRVYIQPVSRVGMTSLSEEYTRAQEIVSRYRHQDLRRGLVLTLFTVGAATWIGALVFLVYAARRVSGPIQKLTKALAAVARGEGRVHIDSYGHDEVGAAVEAFNEMSERLHESQERLVFLTRLSSWQALARKMAHEVKNSLTPIRLTVEEMVARHTESDPEFLQQAAQIVVEEVTTLERRVRAFSELAAEPPVRLERFALRPLVEERLSLLRGVHSLTNFRIEGFPGDLYVVADADLIKGVWTNLLSNAAEAAGSGGEVLIRCTMAGSQAICEVHDSGPGLSPFARETLFEPTISFKKAGMGIGLSIARKSALLCAGELSLVDGELSGAGFRLTLPVSAAEIGETRVEPADLSGMVLHVR